MSIEELKEILITDLLAHLGHRPVSRAKGGRQWFYHSPLRDDCNASFCVSADKNLWYDFGTGQGGNVIDFAKAMNGGCSFKVAASWLESQSREFKQGPPLSELITGSSRSRFEEAGIENVRVMPLMSRPLLSYLWSRGIPADIATRYCKEVHYTIRDRQYFAICFRNIVGGMEIRNPFFKGSHGEKAPSIVTLSKGNRTPSCCVFEGFMDFLSYQTLLECYDNPVIDPVPRDCIILNSTSMVKKAIPFIRVYDVAFAYLDNDAAGIQASEILEGAMTNRTIKMSNRFSKYNDLNDFLVRLSQNNK